MKRTKEALLWIITLLEHTRTSYRIFGGFAARVYGSTRPLADIDIEIPDKKIDKILPYIKKYVIYGPKQYKDKSWNILYLALKYKGQVIDLVGAHSAKIFNSNTKKWMKYSTSFPKATKKRMYGKTVPIMKKEELVHYKKMLHRRVDLQDLKQISNT